jgi:hypothetical protein
MRTKTHFNNSKTTYTATAITACVLLIPRFTYNIIVIKIPGKLRCRSVFDTCLDEYDPFY